MIIDLTGSREAQIAQSRSRLDYLDRAILPGVGQDFTAAEAAALLGTTLGPLYKLLKPVIPPRPSNDNGKTRRRKR